MLDALTTSITKYFTSYSVNSLWGYKKVSLLEVGDEMVPDGIELVIDATTEVTSSLTKTVMQHSSESRKVYMDGTKVNPIKMTINGHIETNSLGDLQKLAQDDKWMFVSLSKDISGAALSMPKNKQSQLQMVGAMASNAVSFFTGKKDDGKEVYNDCKLYVISGLDIKDNGFINTVEVTIDLTEVVLFEYMLYYKYGVKKASTDSKAQQTKEDPLYEIRATKW